MYCIQRKSGCWERGRGGTKRKRHLIMYAFSCEREQKDCECVRKKGERPRERDCVYVRETFL